MKRRFMVVNRSQLGHSCCFAATVVDTARPTMVHGKPYAPNGVPQYEVVCECFGPTDAEMIARELNNA